MKKLLRTILTSLLICTIGSGLFVAPDSALAISCGFGDYIGGGQCRGYLTSGTSWKVPSDWQNAGAYIDAIGAGASGQGTTPQAGYQSGGPGGGGGAFSRKSSGISFSAGQNISYQVGAADVSDTYFNNTLYLLAKSAVTSTGGQAASGVGDLKYSGGNSGADGNPNGYGGGGAAGPNGNGVSATTYDGAAGDNGSGGSGGPQGGHGS